MHDFNTQDKPSPRRSNSVAEEVGRPTARTFGMPIAPMMGPEKKKSSGEPEKDGF